MSERDFKIWVPTSFFEKADAGSKRRRIAGIVSTEKLDKQGEIIIQKGLDFEPFVKEGYFNDNHSKKTADILGEPDGPPKIFQKGDRLPDGSVADAACTWAEGYLFDTPDADRIWTLGVALQKAGAKRRLGYSIEGSVKKRAGPNGRVVAKALVRNIAITNCPVGEGTRLNALVKSLAEVEAESLDKAITVGGSTPGVAVATEGPKTGEGAARVLSAKQDGQVRMVLDEVPESDDEARKKKPLAKSQAVAFIRAHLHCSTEMAEKAFDTLATMKDRGLL